MPLKSTVGSIQHTGRCSLMWTEKSTITHPTMWQMLNQNPPLLSPCTCQSQHSSQSPGRLQLVKNVRTEGFLCPGGIPSLSPFVSLHSQVSISVNATTKIAFGDSISTRRPLRARGGNKSDLSSAGRKKENLNMTLPQSKVSNEPQKSPEVNLHQSWYLNKLPPACDTVSANLIWTQPL